jgi:pyroglutamyl-peptidase
MKTLVLTGFGLWGEEKYNSSWDIVRDNPIVLPPGWQAVTRQLPVSWRRVPQELDDILTDPDVRAVICFGMCAGRAIRVERLAINLSDLDRPDADLAYSPGEYAVPGGPPAYWSRLDVAATLAALRQAGVPAEESRSAGGFLCNFAFYHLMHRLARREPTTVGGFVHVPHFETEGGLPMEMLHPVPPVVATEAAKLADAPMLGLV